MTNPPLSSAPTRLPLPLTQAAYANLSTDFYPWTEILTDLERRQEPTWNAVLDVQQGERWARFVWVAGQARGGLAPNGSEVSLATIMQGLPAARVSLVEVDGPVADMVWDCRTTAAQPLNVAWPELGELLTRERFTGALLSGNQTSYWARGQMVTGTLPDGTQPCAVVVSPAKQGSQKVALWSKVFEVTQRKYPQFAEIWRQVSLQLSGTFTSLDPFDSDISFDGHTLDIAQDAPLEEVLPALQAAYATSLRRMGIRISDLPAEELREQGAWRELGLEDV